ncbi:MAG: hypothetical protein BWY52_02407 [Chloroflexi bacterium ADurb.Bin325]|nr:MAG: hypothetical protein BWY52_02407 [Chloroflexi bacterium ADurb.Bin325]
MNHSDRFIAYRIRVEGLVRQDRFEDLLATPLPEGETLLCGRLDQAGLHGVLNRIRDLGLVLIAVHRVPDEKGIPHA